MQEPEIQAGCTAELVASKIQRISAAALSALERQLHERRVPVEEQAFLAARLEVYRRAATLAAGAGSSHADRCMA